MNIDSFCYKHSHNIALKNNYYICKKKNENYKFHYFYCRSWIPHWILLFLSRIRDPGSGSSYFYRGSGIPDPDPLIFIADPGSRIRILLFLSRILDPGSGILLFYRGSIEDPDPNPDPDPVPGQRS